MKRIVLYLLITDIPKNIAEQLPQEHPVEIRQERLRSDCWAQRGQYYDNQRS